VLAVEWAFPIEVERLVINAMSSDSRKFVAMLETHGPSLLAFVRRLCRNLHDADDVYQDVAVRVWKNFPNRPRLRNARSWLMTIAYRAFVDHYQRRQARESLVEVPDLRTQSPGDCAEKREWAQRVAEAVEGLPPNVREVVTLHYTGGLTLRETAAAMNISTGTVKSRLNSALELLRGLLQ
jgi:RNA polymerase sigma-70 factor (ECF subfamily)